MVKSTSQAGTRHAAFLLAIYFSNVHSFSSNSLTIRSPLRLRGGSLADSARRESLPNPRLYHPHSQSDLPKVLTDIIYVSEEGQQPEDIKECKVIGSWSNWESQETLRFNAASSVWETEKLLSPGEYKVGLNIDLRRVFLSSGHKFIFVAVVR